MSQDSEILLTNEWDVLAKDMVKHVTKDWQQHYKDRILHLEQGDGFSNRIVKKSSL